MDSVCVAAELGWSVRRLPILSPCGSGVLAGLAKAVLTVTLTSWISWVINYLNENKKSNPFFLTVASVCFTKSDT